LTVKADSHITQQQTLPDMSRVGLVQFSTALVLNSTCSSNLGTCPSKIVLQIEWLGRQTKATVLNIHYTAN